MDFEKSIDRLNKLLRGELSATETYHMAIEKVKEPDYLRVLRDNLQSHERKVTKLRDYIVRLGGQPAESSGVWGAWSKLFMGGAKVFGEDAAIAALEEGEDQGLRDYRETINVSDLETDFLHFVNTDLLPEQERTHRALSVLKERGRAPV